MSEPARPLAVLAVTLRYPPYVAGGYELQTRDVVEGLRARGHRVDVLAGRGAALEDLPGVLPWLEPRVDGAQDLFEHSFQASNAERFRLHFLRLANLRATRRALRTTGAEVLLFFNLGLVSLAPILAARLRGVPTLGYVADPWPCNHWLEAWRQDQQARAEKGLRLEWLERAWHTFRGAVRLGELLACSDWMCARLVADGLDPRDLTRAYPGLPPDIVPGPAPRPRAAGEALRVVCASSLWKGKGQDVLVEATARAHARGAHIELALLGAGQPEFRAALEARARELGVAAQVRFTGFLQRAQVDRELVRAHVLAVPSTWEEPFGLVTLEGLAKGLAVVASAAGASPELVRDGIDGRVVARDDPEDLATALVELERDEPRRLALARAGQEGVAQRFSHTAFLDLLEVRLSRLVGRALA